MTHNLDLEFIKPEGIPGPGIAQIVVKTYSHDSDNGSPIITPKCYGMVDFDYEIKRLKSELDEIQKKARKKFKNT